MSHGTYSGHENIRKRSLGFYGAVIWGMGKRHYIWAPPLNTVVILDMQKFSSFKWFCRFEWISFLLQRRTKGRCLDAWNLLNPALMRILKFRIGMDCEKTSWNFSKSKRWNCSIWNYVTGDRWAPRKAAADCLVGTHEAWILGFLLKCVVNFFETEWVVFLFSILGNRKNFVILLAWI